MADAKYTDAEILSKAKSRHRAASSFWSEQLEQERQDTEFQLPELAWTEDARGQRNGQPAGSLPGVTQAIPARPMMSCPKLDQPIGLASNQVRNAQMGISVHPGDEDSDPETAEVFDDLIRKIQRESSKDVIPFAADRAIKVGRGWFRVLSEYDKSTSDPNDQKLVLKRLLYQGTVLVDPAAEEPDFSDAQWMFLSKKLPKSTCEKLWPNADWDVKNEAFATGVEDDDEQEQWADDESGAAKFRIAEYFEKETIEDEDEPEGTRDVVCIYHMSGAQILDKGRWEGPDIPLIPTIGRELQPINGKRVWVGMVRPARDAVRGYNYEMTNAVEVSAMEPRSPIIATKEQTQGYEGQYQTANVRNYPVLYHNPHIVAGQLMPPPSRLQADTSKLAMSLQLVQQMDECIQSSTQTFEPSLGNLSQRDRSGKAIQSLQAQADASQSHFLSNLADITLPYLGRVLVNAIPFYYDRSGRRLNFPESKERNKKARSVLLGMDYTLDQRGNPVPVKANDNAIPAGAKRHDLRQGRYELVVEVGKNYQTKMQEQQAGVQGVLQAAPDLMPVLGPEWLESQDWPGAKASAEILRKMRDKNMPWLAENPDGTVSPEQAQMQNQALKAENQQLKQVAQQMDQAIKSKAAEKQVESQADLMQTQMDGQVKIEVEKIRQAGAFAIAELKVGQEKLALQITEQAKILSSIAKFMHEGRLDDEQGQHEYAMQKDKHAHEREATERQQAHDRAMGAAGAASGADQQDRQQQHERGMSEFEVANRPEPQADGGGE